MPRAVSAVVGAGGHEIAGVFTTEAAARQEIEPTCATPEARRLFFDSFGYPRPDNICPDHFTVEPFDLTRDRPVLDDRLDGHPDSWDYDAVLKENEVQVTWSNEVIDGNGNRHRAGEWAGWSLSWKHGVIFVGRVSETIARKAAALFVSLWLRGVSASFADKLMDGFIWCLELEENRTLTFLGEIKTGWASGNRHFRVSREGLCRQATLNFDTQDRIIAALDPQPDEEIIVTFVKKKRQP